MSDTIGGIPHGVAEQIIAEALERRLNGRVARMTPPMDDPVRVEEKPDPVPVEKTEADPVRVEKTEPLRKRTLSLCPLRAISTRNSIA